MIFPEAVARLDSIDSPKKPAPSFLFASRTITRTKSQQTPKPGVQYVTFVGVLHFKRTT